jgi:hypothetical protein
MEVEIGKISSANNGNYIGETLKGKPNGIGRMTYPDGSYYEGSWKDGMKQGTGLLMLKEKGYQCGVWNKDELDGVFIVTSFDSTKSKGIKTFVGEFKDGEQIGVGSIMYNDGREYYGDLKNFKPAGNGIQVESKKGTYYVGEFLEGNYHGYGVLTVDNKVYQNQFVSGIMEGIGLIKERDGNLWFAYYNNGVADYWGVKIVEIGEQYEIHYRGINNIESFAFERTSTGEVIHREWFDNDFSKGNMTVSDKDGNCKYGTFADNVFTELNRVSPTDINYSNFCLSGSKRKDNRQMVILRENNRIKQGYVLGLGDKLDGPGVVTEINGCFYAGYFEEGAFFKERGIFFFNGKEIFEYRCSEDNKQPFVGVKKQNSFFGKVVEDKRSGITTVCIKNGDCKIVNFEANGENWIIGETCKEKGSIYFGLPVKSGTESVVIHNKTNKFLSVGKFKVERLQSGAKMLKYATTFGTYNDSERLEGNPVVKVFEGGSNYVGGAQEGKIFGNGTMNYEPGFRYTGEWKNGLREGTGTLFFVDGSTLNGKWEKDYLITKDQFTAEDKKILLNSDSTSDNKNISFSSKQAPPQTLAFVLNNDLIFRKSLFNLLDVDKDTNIDDFLKQVIAYQVDSKVGEDLSKVDVYFEPIYCSFHFVALKLVLMKKSIWIKYGFSGHKLLLELNNHLALRCSHYVVKTPGSTFRSIEGSIPAYHLIEDVKHAYRNPKKEGKKEAKDGINLGQAIKNNLPLNLSQLGHLVALGCIIDDVKTWNIGYFKAVDNASRLGLFDANIDFRQMESFSKNINKHTNAILFHFTSFTSAVAYLHVLFNRNDTGSRKVSAVSDLPNHTVLKTYYDLLMKYLNGVVEKMKDESAIKEFLIEGSLLIAYFKIYSHSGKMLAELELLEKEKEKIPRVSQDQLDTLSTHINNINRIFVQYALKWEKIYDTNTVFKTTLDKLAKGGDNPITECIATYNTKKLKDEEFWEFLEEEKKKLLFEKPSVIEDKKDKNLLNKKVNRPKDIDLYNFLKKIHNVGKSKNNIIAATFGTLESLLKDGTKDNISQLKGISQKSAEAIVKAINKEKQKK